MTDDEIAALVNDESNGTWHDDKDGLRVFTPYPGLLADVSAHELVMYFANRDPEDNVRLHLP